MSWFISEIHQ